MARRSGRAWRQATAAWRPPPDVVIVGAQRGGTTSLHTWLCAHAGVAPLQHNEMHYWDNNYDRGERWYRSHYPIGHRRGLTVESSPYMLFHPLSPRRAAQDLPGATRFVALLREPIERAVSHYWLQRRVGLETEPIDVAFALEDERLAGQAERVLRGENSAAHRHFSYRARGDYDDQLERWFDGVGRDRILVVESERLFREPGTARHVLDWLGVAPARLPFPAVNDAPRQSDMSSETRAFLEGHFASHNARLFDMLGTTLWTM